MRLVSPHTLLIVILLILTQGCRTMEGWRNAREKTIANPAIDGVVRDKSNEITQFVIKYSDSFRPYYFVLSREDARRMSYHGPLTTRSEILSEVSNRSAIANFLFDAKSLEAGTSIEKSGAFESFVTYRKINVFKNDTATSCGGITFIPYRVAGKKQYSDVELWERYNILMIPSTQPKPDKYRHLDLGVAMVATPLGIPVEAFTYVVLVPVAMPFAWILMKLGYER